MRTATLAAIFASAWLLAACGRATESGTAAGNAAPAAQPAAAPAVTTNPTPQATDADWTLPGWITPQTTLAQLQARYGAGNVRKQTLDGPEGMTYDAYVLFPDDPTRRLELEFFDDNGVVSIAGIRIEGATSRWHDGNGLHPGMTLAELVAKNGKPIRFSGLYWDYGGTVQDWSGGTLAPPDNLVVYPTVILAPRPDLGDTDKIPSGEDLFHSDDPHWPGIGKDLVIDKVLLSWPDEND